MSYNKHINTFSTETDYDNYIWSSHAEIPNVGYVTSGNTVHYVNKNFNDFVLYGTYNPASYTGETFTFGNPAITAHCDANEGIFYCTEEDISGKTLTSLESTYMGDSDNRTIKLAKNAITSFKKWKIDTSNVTTLSSMLMYLPNVTYFDFSYFNTEKVTIFRQMLQSYLGDTLDFSSFSTSAITTIGSNNLMIFGPWSDNNTVKKILISEKIFDTSVTTFNMFGRAGSWTDAESLATLVEVIPDTGGITKTISFSNNTKNALTTEQKAAIQAKGWTIA